MKLIDKDVLVAEINRQKDGCYKICVGDFDFLKRSYPQHYYSIETYDKILSFLETLEVKEVECGDRQPMSEAVKIGETEIYLEDDGGEPPYDGKQWLDLGCIEHEIPTDKFNDGDVVEILIRKIGTNK